MENNLVRMDDWKLVRAMNFFRESGNLQPLRNECCVWMLHHANRMGASEDDASEVVLKFLENIEGYLEKYFTGNYPEFPGFLYTVTRHLVYNQRKLGKNRPGEYYIALWNETASISNRRKDILVHLSHELETGIMSLPGRERLILKLKNSLSLNPSDTRQLRKMLGRGQDSLTFFLQDYRRRVERKLVMRDAFLTRMNHYNKKIMVHGNAAYQIPKKRLLARIENMDQLYSFRELGEIFDIHQRTIAVIYRNALKLLRENLCCNRQMNSEY